MKEARATCGVGGLRLVRYPTSHALRLFRLNSHSLRRGNAVPHNVIPLALKSSWFWHTAGLSHMHCPVVRPIFYATSIVTQPGVLGMRFIDGLNALSAARSQYTTIMQNAEGSMRLLMCSQVCRIFDQPTAWQQLSRCPLVSTWLSNLQKTSRHQHGMSNQRR